MKNELIILTIGAFFLFRDRSKEKTYGGTTGSVIGEARLNRLATQNAPQDIPDGATQPYIPNQSQELVQDVEVPLAPNFVMTEYQVNPQTIIGAGDIQAQNPIVYNTLWAETGASQTQHQIKRDFLDDVAANSY
jgi:hypothetical protein